MLIIGEHSQAKDSSNYVPLCDIMDKERGADRATRDKTMVRKESVIGRES